MADGYASVHRPTTLSEYMGSRVKNTVINRLKDPDNRPHTILIHGPLGCGKTTIARLILMMYQCEELVDGQPCGKCSMCLEIKESLIRQGVKTPGVEEVDIASESGKADMTALLEEAITEPMYPIKYKVLILDECHMASKAAQNKLLKITEEPPDHLIFIFCTTDPDSMLATLRSRCQLTIEVTKPTINDMVEKMMDVSRKEGLTVTREALIAIAKYKKNTPRSCLSLLEDVAIEYNGVVNVENVSEKIGSVSYDLFLEYYKCANTSIEDILAFVRKLEESHAYAKFMSELLRFTLDIIYIKSGVALDEFPADFIKQVKSFTSIYNKAEIDLLLQILEHAVSVASKNENSAELAVITTAIRIGKIKILTDLSNSKADAKKDDKLSNRNHLELIEQERMDNLKIESIGVEDALTDAIFGKEIREVVGIELQLDNDDEEEMDDGELLSDDDVLKLFTK